MRWMPIISGLVSVPVSAMVSTAQIAPLQTITVSPGYGVTVMTDEPVYRVWIDDGSRVAVDFDRPVEEGANIIHVYQTQSQGGFSSDGNTMMTLVYGSGGVQKVRIQFGSGPVAQTVLDLSGSSPGASRLVASGLQTGTSERIAILRAGLSKALSDGSMSRGSALHSAVESYLDMIGSGVSLQQAAERTGLQLEVIGRLAKLGMESSQPRPSAPPVLPIDEEIQVQVPLDQPVLAIQEKTQKSSRQAKRKPRDVPAPDIDLPGTITQAEPKDAEANESEIVVVTPAPDKTSESALPDNPHTLANAIVRGLAVANRTGEVGYRASLSFQVQSVVRLLRRGADLESAIARVGVPPQSVQRLLQLGLS